MATEPDPALRRLAGAVALGQGFQFHIAVCQGPRQVRQLLAALAKDIPERRGGVVRSEHLAPYELLPRDRALDGEELAQAVMARLAALAPPAAGELLIVALDATPASEEDAPAWRRLFRRMNEQRNALAAGLDGAFLLCLPEWLEGVFAHEAADFWSIRGLSVALAADGQASPGREPLAASADFIVQSRLEGAADLGSRAEEIAAARERAQQMPDDWRAQRSLMALLGRQGGHDSIRGDTTAALAAYREALAIAETLVQRAPADTGWQRDLSISHNRIGNALVAQGDLTGAIGAYRQGLAICETLARCDPANTEWQRDLSICHNKIGNVLFVQSDLAGALGVYRRELAIRETLARRDPANTEWQRDLSICHCRIGDVLVAQGDLSGALGAYRQGLAICETLARRDPANTEWQSDLSLSHEQIGDVLVDQGDLTGALGAYRRGLAIRETLVRRDPANAEWQCDMAYNHYKIGNVLGGQGDFAGASATILRGLAIVKAIDPANSQLILSIGRPGAFGREQTPAERHAAVQRGRDILNRLHAEGRLPASQDHRLLLPAVLAALADQHAQ